MVRKRAGLGPRFGAYLETGGREAEVATYSADSLQKLASNMGIPVEHLNDVGADRSVKVELRS